MTDLSPLAHAAIYKGSEKPPITAGAAGAGVSIASPWLPPLGDVIARLEGIWNNGRLTNGALVERLEHETAVYLGVPHCVAVSSCTTGLMLLARCLNLRGEVILPSFTFFAGGHALLWNGLTPVFADCDPLSFTMDPASAARVCTRHTSAILGVHLFGCPAAVEPLQQLAIHHGIPLIFDGAHAFGARAAGRGVSQWGDATVFSLAATKPLVAGEGGIIATADIQLARRLRQARNYGNDGSYDCPILGLNGRMTELQAALALAGLPYVAEGIERRKGLAEIYRRCLAPDPGLRPQQVRAEYESTWNGFPLCVTPRSGTGREAIEQVLAAARIETRRYYDPPLHRQKLYRRFYQPAREPLANTESISCGIVSLPLHAALEPNVVVRIAQSLLDLDRSRPAAWAAPIAL